MRSSVGVGITPPNVLGAPKPTSSVMMRSTLGAPVGGTVAGGHHDVESPTTGLTSPPNFGGAGGRALDWSVSVYEGVPGFAGPPPPGTEIGTTKAPTATTRRIEIAERTIFFFMIPTL